MKANKVSKLEVELKSFETAFFQVLSSTLSSVQFATRCVKTK